MTDRLGEAFAHEWLEAWNSHDVDRILGHYSDDLIFTSPYVQELTGRDDGTLFGKDELRDYFSRALASFPDLEFRDLEVFAGATGVCLVYRSVRDLRAAEVMLLEVGVVTRVFAHYRQVR
jgi:ketosteroid isomerase-like protein